MSNIEVFTHLELPFLFKGKPVLNGFGRPSEKRKLNCENRIEHGNYLKKRTEALSRFWKERRSIFEVDEELSTIKGVPLLLEIDPLADIEFLRGLGFEIVCDLPEGYIIVATEDADFSLLKERLDTFIEKSKPKCDGPANIYALCDDSDRLKKILSKNLESKWGDLLPDTIYTVDVGISCCGNIKLPDRPKRKADESEDSYNKKIDKWTEKYNKAFNKWDEIKTERDDAIGRIISKYNGEIIDDMADVGGDKIPDSFTIRLKISGKGLKDFVLNYPYIFEVEEAQSVRMDISRDNNETFLSGLNIISPDSSDPIVCIVDSGIQEGHALIAQAIIESDSKSLLKNNDFIGDEIGGGGHGTRVAGAVLYPNGVPTSGNYQLPCRIRNCRVLDETNSMPSNLYPPKVIADVVKMYHKDQEHKSKIFNHSIGSKEAYQLMRMSAWAAEIDAQSYDNDILFVQPTGNISKNLIETFLEYGKDYPKYLDDDLCRLSDPAQSLQALTVGSISPSDYETDDQVILGKKDDVSSFSRSGPGIWDVLKPEVVEYGGNFVRSKSNNPITLSTPSEVCPELVRTSPEGPAFARDEVGTSFSAPKVTFIASQIQKILPNAPALLYRGLVAQSARWPERFFSKINSYTREEFTSIMRRIGYGIPSLDRATSNSEFRITLITPDVMTLADNEAHVFRIPIPKEISSIGDNCDILVEITLSYAASPRRTRRMPRGYLSTWLDWCCSKNGETENSFIERVFEKGSTVEDEGNFHWVIGDSVNHGIAEGLSKNKGTLQKDWCIIKSNQLSDSFCVAVRGHKGWGSLNAAKYSLVVSFEAINKDMQLYEPIKNNIEAEINSKVNTEFEIEEMEIGNNL